MRIQPKPPQELVAQYADTHYHGFSDIYMDGQDATNLTAQHQASQEAFHEGRPYLQDDETVTKTMTIIGTTVLASGQWNPDQGKGARGRIDRGTTKVLSETTYHTPETARESSKRFLRKQGLLEDVRYRRRSQEEEFKVPINDFLKEHELEADAEQKRMAELRTCLIDVNTIDDTQRVQLRQDFPGGNFLYHGARSKELLKMLASGDLANTKLIDEREASIAAAESRAKTRVANNSGYEGISWSMNGIDALPGDRYHLAGFLAAPEIVLTEDQQLTIPSRPSPNEVLQMSDTFDANRFFDAKTQGDLLYDLDFMGETNSVRANIIGLRNWKHNANSQDASDEPQLLRAQRGVLAKPNAAQKLRELYAHDDNDLLRLSPDLLQQIDGEVPPAAVWLQAAIDSGRLEQTPFAQCHDVIDILDSLDDSNYGHILALVKADYAPYEAITESALGMARNISVPVERMYFVAPRKDAATWLKVLARLEHVPAGILLYDDKKVRLENFRSDHRGDHKALTQELQQAIIPAVGYIAHDEVLGRPFTDDMRAGTRHHVIAESYLNQRRTIRKVDGELKVI